MLNNARVIEKEVFSYTKVNKLARCHNLRKA